MPYQWQYTSEIYLSQATGKVGTNVCVWGGGTTDVIYLDIHEHRPST